MLAGSVPLAVQSRAGDAAVRREVGPDFGHNLIEGEAVNPGEDEGAKLGVGFDPRRRSGPVCRARCGGFNRGLNVALNNRFKGG